VACATRRTLPFAAGAGALAGMAVLTRPNLAPLALVVGAAALGWPRTVPGASFDARRLVACLAGLVPGVAALAAFQRSLYGSPFRTGYGDVADFFAVANIWPNVGDYTSRILAGEGPALAVAAAALALLSRSRTVAPATPLVKLAAASAVILLALYLPYGVFPDWSSFRFLMPGLPLAFAALGALMAAALERLPPPARGAALLAAMTLAVSLNVTHAAQKSVYALHDYEARYRTMGRYLAASRCWRP
jgi:hypothetical protein